MKDTLRSALYATVALATPQIASATLLVGFSDFDGSANSEGHDYALSGFSGLAIDQGSEPSYNTGGSLDGSMGTTTFSEFTPGTSDGYLRSINAGDPIIQVTNNSAGAYSLTSLLFDAANQGGGNTVAVTYRLGLSGAWLSLFTTLALSNSGSAGASVDYQDNVVNLVGLGITLLNGNSIQFKFDGNTNGRIDNIALTGLQAIPEPASLVALGCLLGSGVFLRQRRREPAVVAELA